MWKWCRSDEMLDRLKAFQRLQQQLQRGGDERFNGGGGRFGGGLFHDLVCVHLFVAEGDEREHGIGNFCILRRGRVGCAGGFPCSRDADLVLQFDDDALGGLFADALCFRQSGDVAGDDACLERRHARAAKHVERSLGADAADVVHKQPEEVAFGGGHETVEDMRVFADGEMGEDFELRTSGREPVVAGKRNEHMISDTADIENDMRGERFDERAGKVCDHAASLSRCKRSREAIRWMFKVWIFLLLSAATLADDWFFLPAPRFMRYEISFPIEGAKNTVITPAKLGRAGLEFPNIAAWSAAGLDEGAVRKATEKIASEWLKQIKPEYVRDRRKVIEYAVMSSDKFPACVTVFAPEFRKSFEEIFGPKLLVVIPNRQTVFVFPGVAVDLSDHSPAILEAWRGAAPKVGLEVFELSEQGLKAVGKIEEP